MSAIEFEHLAYEVKTIRNQSFTLVKDLNFAILANEFVCLIGASGSGKTTTLNLTAGFLKPSHGQITFQGTKGDNVRRAMCFQSDTVFGWMTCEANLLFALQHNSSVDRKAAQIMLEKILAVTGLESFRHFYPRELSGGMRKRLELGRAWLCGAPVLLLDEPLGQLDYIMRREMQATLQKLWLEEPRTVMMVTHDIEEALYLADRILIMHGPPGTVTGFHNIPFPRPRTLDTLFSNECQLLRRQILNELEGDGDASN